MVSRQAFGVLCIGFPQGTPSKGHAATVMSQKPPIKPAGFTVSARHLLEGDGAEGGRLGEQRQRRAQGPEGPGAKNRLEFNSASGRWEAAEAFAGEAVRVVAGQTGASTALVAACAAPEPSTKCRSNILLRIVQQIMVA